MNIKNTIRKVWEMPAALAAFSSFSGGLAVHMFGLVNVLQNHDSVYRVPTGYGTGVQSGRWFLSVLGDLTTELLGGYNLPWVNGVLFLVLVGLTAGLVTSVLQLTKKRSAVLLGLLFACFPSVASTLFYRFTSVYYGIALVLSVLAVWVVKRYRYGFFLSIVLIAFSMGIYQAYISFTITLFLLSLLKQTLEGTQSIRTLIGKGVGYCLILIFGLLAYYLLLRLSLLCYHVSLTDYQGISQMGGFSLSLLPTLLYRAFSTFCRLPFDDYLDLAQGDLLKDAYLIAGLFTILLLCLVLWKRTKTLPHTLMSIALFLLLPMAINFIVIMCPDPNTYLYTLMVHSFALVLCIPLLLLDLFPPISMRRLSLPPIAANIVSVLLSIVIVCYSYQTNVNYTSLYYANEQARHFFTGLVTQIRMTEGFTSDKEWAFIGGINDPMFTEEWNRVNPFGGNKHGETLIKSRWYSWVEHYVGIDVRRASTTEIRDLKQRPEIQEMPCWPDQGSIKVIDNYVVVKFEE